MIDAREARLAASIVTIGDEYILKMIEWGQQRIEVAISISKDVEANDAFEAYVTASRCFIDKGYEVSGYELREVNGKWQMFFVVGAYESETHVVESDKNYLTHYAILLANEIDLI